MFVGFEFLLRLDEFFQVGVVGVKSTPFGCAVKSRPKMCYITTSEALCKMSTESFLHTIHFFHSTV